MRSIPNLLIALSMMALVPGVAHNSWAADDGAARSPSLEPSSAALAGESTPADGATGPAAKRKANAATTPAAPPAEEPRVFGGAAQASHKYQTGLSIMPGSGYRLIVPYKESQDCGDRSGGKEKRVCANYVPFFLDLQLSFGVVARADIIFDMRFGIQKDPAFTWSRQFALAPGIRFWLDQDVAFKFYTTLQFVYDHLDFRGTGPRNDDVGMRNANGLMYDPMRNVGFFVQFAETIGMMRWFRIDLDIGMGAQIRFP